MMETISLGGGRRVVHFNVVSDVSPIALPSERVFEIERLTGDAALRRPEGIGWALAEIRRSGPHHHEKTTEYYFVLRGRGDAHLDGGEAVVHLEENDVLIIPPGTVHHVESEEGISALVISSPPWKKEDHLTDAET
jgi:mannose-6-phosphate isomerase-like protein (cupin superfamily)